MKTETTIQEDLQLVRKNWPTAIGAGAFGGIMPFIGFWVSHFHMPDKLERWKDYVLVAVVIGCVLFSVTTVWKMSHQTSKEWYRAPCWIVGLEGTMIALPDEALWLSVTSLCYLVVINAVSMACVVARHATPAQLPTVTDVVREQNLPRRVAAKVVEQQRRVRPAPAAAT